MMRKVLVTGGAGYIGSVLTPYLLDQGYTVTVMDNFMYKQHTLLDVCHNKSLTIINGDVRDTELLVKQVKSHDIIIPLAAIVGAPACDKDQKLATAVNQVQAEQIANTIHQSQQVLFPVTNSGYGIGQADQYCDETTPLNPISHYGRTKVAAEAALLDSGSAVTFRLATVFGTSPRMRMDLLVNDFVYRAFSDSSIVLFESHFKRNYIHIRDIASVMLHGIKHFDVLRNEAYNVGLSSANLSKMELCTMIKQHLPQFQTLESEIGEDPDKRDYIVSNDKIESTGWMPNYSLDDGISELLKFYSFAKTNQFNNL